jgi:hypothetical protein
MGFFRFRRSIRIAPGVRWNIGKKGSSVSFGGHGLTHTIGAKGSRTTIGIPGTGVSYTQVHSSPKRPSAAPPPLPIITSSSPGTKKPATSIFFYVLGMILLGIWLLTKLAEQSTPRSPVADSTASLLPTASPAASVPYHSPRTFSQATHFPPVPINASTPKYSLPVSPPPATQYTPLPSVEGSQPTPTSTPSLPVTYRVVNIIKGDVLNIRTGPGASYPIVARMQPGVRGITLGPGRISNDWTMWQEISVGGYNGWVNEIYLEVESPGR